MTATTLRPLTRDGIPAIWTIDRSEINHRMYRLIDGRLVLHPGCFALQGWPPGHIASDSLHLPAFLERGGHLVGAFHGDRLVGLLGVGNVRLGVARDGIQVTRLYVSRDVRGQGVGVRLFDEARSIARASGARFLYVSSTPSENTVDFYLGRGCRLADSPDPDLLALEPEDIHLICPL